MVSVATRSRVRLFLGVDVGNGYTNARDIKFKSRVQEVTKAQLELRMDSRNVKKSEKGLSETHYVVYNGKYYIVGEGEDFVIDGRHTSTSYLLCLLTAIAEVYKAHEYIDLSVCVGLPADLFLSGDESLKEAMYKAYGGKTFDITVDGREVAIKMSEFNIYLEGAYPILVDDMREVVVIDMGMGTTNMLKYNNGELIDRATVPFGMRGLCVNMAKELNDKKINRRVDWEDIDENFGKRSMMIGREGEVDISFLDEHIVSYLTNNIKDYKERFNINNAKAVYIMGGGGLATAEYWKDVIGGVTLSENAQEVNSKVFDILSQYALEGE